MKLLRPTFIMAVVVAGRAAAPLAAEIIDETAPLYTRIGGAVAVPADLSDHVLFVNVMVNGQGPFRMFIDTGCSVTVFSPELAAAVKAAPAPDEDDEATTAAFNSLGDPVEVQRVLIDTIELGGVRFEGVLAGVLPMMGLAQIDGRRIDGILGFSLFSDVVLGLDYPGRRLLLSPGWPEHLPPLRAEMTVREHSEVPFIAATLQDKSFEVEIDSGATGNLHLPTELAAVLSWKAEPRPGLLIEAVDEEARDYLGRLNGRLTLGSLVLPEPVASVGGSAPSIGYDVLNRFCIVFDQRADKVRFYSGQAGPIASPSERSVGLSIKLDPAGWRIARIIPGSPAEEARLAVGDLVTRIEGKPARDWSHDQIHDWVETHDAMRLGVLSGGSSRDIQLRVWLLVP
jgi:predicted aspartyl protease